MQNRSAGGGNDPHGDSLARNYSFYKSYMAQRHIDFIPNLSAGSGGISDAIDPDVAEGVWVKDTLFEFNETEANAVHSPVVPLHNMNFKQGLDGWEVCGHGDPPLQQSTPPPPCTYNSTFGSAPGPFGLLLPRSLKPGAPSPSCSLPFTIQSTLALVPRRAPQTGCRRGANAGRVSVVSGLKNDPQTTQTTTP